MKSTFDQGQALASSLFPGLIASATLAAAATYLSQHYHAPVMLFALLLGMAMNFLSQEGPCRPGVEFAAKHLLRLGVALLAAAAPPGLAVVDLSHCMHVTPAAVAALQSGRPLLEIRADGCLSSRSA